MIYVYTSILNGWDNLRPPCLAPEAGTRYICFTNVPTLPSVEPWEFRPVYTLDKSCRTARLPKILPHLMLPEDAEYSICHDGNFQLKGRPSEMIAGLLTGGYDWAAHKHPCRTCIYQEANVILCHPTMKGWRDQDPERVKPIEEEMRRYVEMGFPHHQGLWANGMIVRRHNSRTRALNERWWRLYSEGGERDQLSFPVARHIEDVRINTIDADVTNSPFLRFYYHAAWHEQPASREYSDERKRIRGRLEQLKAITGFDGGVKYPAF